jgi:hypothetical protein
MEAAVASEKASKLKIIQQEMKTLKVRFANMEEEAKKREAEVKPVEVKTETITAPASAARRQRSPSSSSSSSSSPRSGKRSNSDDDSSSSSVESSSCNKRGRTKKSSNKRNHKKENKKKSKKKKSRSRRKRRVDSDDEEEEEWSARPWGRGKHDDQPYMMMAPPLPPMMPSHASSYPAEAVGYPPHLRPPPMYGGYGHSSSR